MIADVVIEEAAFCEGVLERGIGLRRYPLIVVSIAAGHEPYRKDPAVGIVRGYRTRSKHCG